MNWKIIFIGGVVFYVTQFIVGLGSGAVIHEGVLKELYLANAGFWRPELNEVPPDMAALMPRWITVGLICAFILAAIYSWIRSALNGAGWLRGVKFGLICWLFLVCFCAGWSGIFNLPDAVWFWWAVEGLLYYLVGGAALGWVSEKLSPAD